MKKLTYFLSFLFLSILLFSSCTFQKRVHNRGFHIDWNSKSKLDKTNNKETAKKEKEKEKEREEVLSKQEVEEATENSKFGAAPEESISAGTEINPIIIVKKTPIFKIVESRVKSIKKVNNTKPTKGSEEEPDLNIFGIAGMILALIAIAAIFASIILSEFELFVIITLLFGLLSIILSAIGLAKSFSNPYDRIGRVTSTIGLILGILALLFWPTIIFLLILTFGGGF